MKKRGIILLALWIITFNVRAQQEDSLVRLKGTGSRSEANSIKKEKTKSYGEKQIIKSLVIPSVLITYGFISLGNNGLKNINEEIKEEAWSENPHQLKHIDNILQFAPAISVYGLNAMGINGKNNFRDRSMIYVLSNVILNATVFPLKNITHRLRPDSSAYTAFPSGHTAEAFASAEFMRMEYKDVSPWYGVAGYLMAATTGYLRLYNNKHWLSDVVTGAGIGIASTKISYWLYPKIKKRLFKDKQVHTALMPVYQNRSIGFSLVHNF